MSKQTVDYVRNTTTGKIHATKDVGRWETVAICRSEPITGEVVSSSIEMLWRNPDLCAKCAEKLAKNER